MGLFVIIAIVLFVLGSMMALKPSGIDQRLDKLRMTARRLQLNPKLVACPDWVRGRDNEYGRGMLGQYCLVLENMQLPQARFGVIDGQWRVSSQSDNHADSAGNAGHKTLNTAVFGLDKTPLNLPLSIEPFVKALSVKANSIVIFWEDINYVRPVTNPNYKPATIEKDLLLLKAQLQQWATQLQKTPPHAPQHKKGHADNTQNFQSRLLNRG